MMPESALLRDILDAALSEQERARIEGRDLAALQSIVLESIAHRAKRLSLTN